MMTKKQYANFIVDHFCKDNNIEREKVEDWGRYLTMSGKLAVCLEYLGLLTENQKHYSETRGGIEFAGYDKEKNDAWVFSTRELMSFLPDN